MSCGYLIYYNKNNERSCTELNLHPNETYTIGTGFKCDIRLKVEKAIPEWSMIRTKAEGVTEFNSNGISECQINNKRFQGIRYLIPGDTINLLGKQFKYVNPSLGEESIEMLQKENRKLFCKGKLEDRSNKRRTVIPKKSFIRSSVSSKGSKTPAPKSAYNLFVHDFVEEDIENHPITPSKNNKPTHFDPKRKNIFSTPQYTKRPDDTNCFNFLQYQLISLNIGRSPLSSTPSSVNNDNIGEAESTDLPGDLISCNATSLRKEMTNSDENVTMLDDISNPFSKNTESLDFNVDDSPPILEMTSYSSEMENTGGEKRLKSILKKPRQSNYNVDETIYEEGDKYPDQIGQDENTLQKRPIKSFLKRLEEVNAIGTPVKSKIIKTPIEQQNTRQSILHKRSASASVDKTSISDTAALIITPAKKMSDVIQETPAQRRVTRRSISMTEDVRTPKSERKILNESTNFVPTSTRTPSPGVGDGNSLKKSTGVHLLRDPSACGTSPRKYLERFAKPATRTRRFSEIIDSRTEMSDFGSPERKKNSPVERNTPNLAILANESFVTRRKSGKSSYASSKTKEVAVQLNYVNGDEEYSTASSSDHYDSDKDNSQLSSSKLSGIDTLEMSVVKSPMRRFSRKNSDANSSSASGSKAPIDDIYSTISDREDIGNYEIEQPPSEVISSTTSTSPFGDESFERSSVGDPVSMNNTLTGTAKKRRMSASYALTDTEMIKDLLNISSPPNRFSSDDFTDSKGIQELLDSSPPIQSTSEDSKNDSASETPTKACETPEKDLADVKGVENSLATPELHASSQSDLSDVSGLRKVPKSPKNDLADIKGVKKLFATPKLQKSPRNDLNDVKGLKKLLATPKESKSPKNDLTDIKGVKKLFATPKLQKAPRNDLSDVKGLKKFLATPKQPKSPKNDLTDIKGVKKILATPKLQKAPRNDLSDIRGVKTLLASPKQPQNPPKNDLSDVRGVKKLLGSPTVQNPPKNSLTDVRGVKKLLATPRRMQKSPKNDLTDIKGVKKMLSTPKVQKQPKNDLSDLRGIKMLMSTPKLPQKRHYDDLSDVSGVKRLLATPKVQKLPKDDLTDVSGVKKLLKTPKRPQKQPKNDLSDVRGIKKLMATPQEQNPPRNDLTDVRGVKDLFKLLESNTDKGNEIDYDGLKDLFTQEKDRSNDDDTDPFDKLINRKPCRTYKGKSVSPQNRNAISPKNLTPTVLEWVEDQNKRFGNEKSPYTSEDTIVPEGKRIKRAAKGRKRSNNADKSGDSTQEDAKRPARQTRRNLTKETEDIDSEEDEIISLKNRSLSAKKKVEEIKGNLRKTHRERNLRVAFDITDNEQEETMSLKNLSTRSTKRNKVREETEKNDSAKDIVEGQAKNKEIVKRSARIRNKKAVKEVSPTNDVEEQEILPKPRTRKTKKQTQKEVIEEKESSATSTNEDNIPAKPPAKRGRKKKSDDLPTITITTTPSEETTARPTRRGKSKRKAAETDTDNSITSDISTGGTKKKALFNPDLYAEVELSTSEEVGRKTEEQPSRTLRSRRVVNLPKMLEEFEVNVKRSSASKTPPKRVANKRKVPEQELDPEPETEIRRSKRTRANK